jgi:hypothetical protein
MGASLYLNQNRRKAFVRRLRWKFGSAYLHCVIARLQTLFVKNCWQHFIFFLFWKEKARNEMEIAVSCHVFLLAFC